MGDTFVKYGLLCILLVNGLPVHGADINVLTNPGFESGTTGWTDRNCSISAVSSPLYTGAGSARAFNRTADWQGIKQEMLGKMIVGETYTISGWIRLENASSDTVKVTIEKADSNGTSYHNVDTATATNSGWTQLSGDYTLTADGTLTELFVYFEGPVSGVNFFVDDAAVIGPEIIPGQANGQIDINTRYQTIEGFGAAGAWYEGWLTSNSQREAIYDLIFGDLGLDIYRLRNTYDQGTEGADYMSRSAQIVAEAIERNPNLKILISSWSPPADLKSNGAINGGSNATLIGGPSNYDYDGFADWWADSITEWAGYGIDPDYISIQNEPDYDASWDSCRFDPTENSTVAGYNQAFEAVYTEMNSRFGASMPKMLGPECIGLGYNALDNFLNAIINHNHVYGYAHHLYHGGNGQDPDSYLPEMQDLNASWGSKPLFQTEYEDRIDGNWPDALNLAHLLYNSLVVEGVSAYLYWDLFWADGGLIGLPSYGAPTYTINSDYYGFKHYSAFIYPDWQRVDAVADNPNLKLSAYISPDNQQLTVVMVNIDSAMDLETDLSFSGFSIDSGDLYRTTVSENCIPAGTYNTPGIVTVPANGIITLSLTAVPPLYGDMDGDYDVDIQDLPDFLMLWLENECSITEEMDLNDDCVINHYEFDAFTENWLDTFFL